MSVQSLPTEHRLGFLLLRDNHAVPLRGISPTEIKAGAKHHIPNPDHEPLKHRLLLNAIVDRLGFDGDFGTFQHRGWPEFQKFLATHRCTRRAGLFPVDHGGCIDLFFTKYQGPTPEQLADRVFVGETPAAPVFLGYGVDWSAWDQGNGYRVPASAIDWIPGDRTSAKKLAQHLFAQRHALMGHWGFLDDKLVKTPLKSIEEKTYWENGSDLSDRQASKATTFNAIQAFRSVFDSRPEGWARVLRFNERLAVLRAHSGEWDLLWMGYCEQEPPEAKAHGQSQGLAVEDLAISLMSQSDHRRSVHFQQGVWREKDAHEAEHAFYKRGNSIAQRRMTSDADVLLSWAREQGFVEAPVPAQLSETTPPGFKVMTLGGRRLAVSEMVTVDSFDRMLTESGYGQRRAPDSETLERANGKSVGSDPVGASWADAQAYCAWLERKLAVAVRLLKREEFRALRPAYSNHYDLLAQFDFPWEHSPPQQIRTHKRGDEPLQVPSAVCWSESRFFSTEPQQSEHMRGSGLATKSSKRWIEDFPPHASWMSPLPVQKHQDLRFIDAWDAYEWCQEKGWVNGRFWEGPIGSTSWGAYKNLKTTFRVVLDLEG
ncbi:SUMF1/EgtB/PvdO family nonheme iron enzyme [Acidovorax sp. NCPPB 4044]|uniref:SUMF1/EgtB/PvdO family nonheme iron enzyme n=1 Tax=Acidovorax sp. NCPPB 4044 TaxID=2940490 RepID=UPI0023033710|nr:SUMF1/EgtB/PvdO family nonheme iron enzyme [Acidovorax sp. NCPPB 4044]MDA8522940.1 formylglycine-generating enzyme family protein [Acidovorax sp. NCPPB 4044]